MKKLILVFFLLIVFKATYSQEYMIGADLSFVKEAEDSGFVFKENGKSKSCIQIFKDHGYNWIRLRLFHSPELDKKYKLPNNLEYTIALAKEAKSQGFKFLLDYHYSDVWADPGKQFIPNSWKGKSPKELEQVVFEYTQFTMLEFKKADVYPDMVQVGNEISNGILWPIGKLPDNWDNFANLLKAGINGVKASCGNNPCPEIMIHIDKGGDMAYTKYFYDKIRDYKIKYDVIGQSYYPWWHGSLLDFRECLHFASKEYNKDVIVVEVAYNFRSQEYKNKIAPFPETPEGQKEFLEEVNNIILNVPNGRGRGMFWWEPAAPNRGFESRTFFDEEGNVMPVINVFDKYIRH